MKKCFVKFLILELLFGAPAFAMNRCDTEKMDECIQHLISIDDDVVNLSWFFTTVFQEMGKKGKSKYKPSEVIKLFKDEDEYEIEDLNLSIPWYVKHVLSAHYKTFDKEFLTIKDKSKSLKDTWEQFDEYFKTKGLIKAIADYKEKYKKKNQQVLKPLENFSFLK